MIEFERIRPEDMRESFPGLFEDCRFTDVGTGWRALIDDMCKVFDAVRDGGRRRYQGEVGLTPSVGRH